MRGKIPRETHGSRVKPKIVEDKPKTLSGSGQEKGFILLKAYRTKFRVAPKDTASMHQGPSRMRRRPRLGGSLDRG